MKRKVLFIRLAVITMPLVQTPLPKWQMHLAAVYKHLVCLVWKADKRLCRKPCRCHLRIISLWKRSVQCPKYFFQIVFWSGVWRSDGADSTPEPISEIRCRQPKNSEKQNDAQKRLCPGNQPWWKISVLLLCIHSKLTSDFLPHELLTTFSVLYRRHAHLFLENTACQDERMMEIFNYIQANYQATALSDVAEHIIPSTCLKWHSLIWNSGILST